ncbi:MAG: ATP-binding protein [Deltaproteobacteria bacterium]|nr:ATP-binding protein [Deltaproteobacteria bacterium]
MASFVPLEPPATVPSVGSTIETPIFELKGALEAKPPFHRAKDVAAFANHLGGTILVGAIEVAGRLDSFRPLAAADASDVRVAYSKAVTDFCSPRPRWAASEFAVPGGLVVAINVWPHPGVVGVRTTAAKQSGYGGDAWVYPVRTGVDASYIIPEQLPMFMDPRIRRAAVMLHGTVGSQVVVRAPWGSGYRDMRGKMDSIDEGKNTFWLAEVTQPDSGGSQSFPIDAVRTVYWANSAWRISLDRFWD